jgi:hypothetical protein
MNSLSVEETPKTPGSAPPALASPEGAVEFSLGRSPRGSHT